MNCENCGRLTEGGYCDCMIDNGEFKGAHWRKEDDSMTQVATRVHVLADESLGGVKREYVEVERKAEVGERVIIVKVHDLNNEGYRIGDIFEVYSTWENGRDEKSGVDTKCGISLFDEEYRVLEPVASESSPQSTDDIIANLVARVSSLERRNTELERREEAQRRLNGVLSQRISAAHCDIETWAQEVEKVRHELGEKVEMVIDDIVTLDERANEAQIITLDVGTFAKLIGGVRG